MIIQPLLLAVLAASGPTSPEPPIKVKVPRQGGALEPLKPLKPLKPLTPRTLQIERGMPSNPFLGRPAESFSSIPGPRSLPPTAALKARIPDVAGQFNFWVNAMIFEPKAARDLDSAKMEAAQELPVGVSAPRKVWVRDVNMYKESVLLTDPNLDNLMGPEWRRSEETPTVIVTHFPPLPPTSLDRFFASQFDPVVASMRAMAAQQAKYNQEKLGYDRVRSLRTPDGPQAATSARDYVPRAMPTPPPAPKRGATVYSAPIGPMPIPAAVAPPVLRGWHPPMAIPASTPLP